YLVSPFRIAGLPVNATAREVARQFERIRIHEKWGQATGAGLELFPLQPPPTRELLREAQERLRDPESRFTDEFFWFWPEQFGQSRPDGPLALLAAGNIQGACEAWERAIEEPGRNGWARHNLAVLAHLLALDLE